MGHVSGPVAVPEHLYTAASQGAQTHLPPFLRVCGDTVVPCCSKTSFCTSQVVGVAVFFALLLKPVALEETEEIEQVFLGKKGRDAALLEEVGLPYKVMHVLPSKL